MTETQYETLKPFERTWNAYKVAGTVTLSHEDKKKLEAVYNGLFNRTTNIYCPTCVDEMFSSLMKAYTEVKEKFETQPKAKRPRILGIF
jgi:hypothetical protein